MLYEIIDNYDHVAFLEGPDGLDLEELFRPYRTMREQDSGRAWRTFITWLKANRSCVEVRATVFHHKD